MKITMLSKIDWTASGHRLHDAIKQHTDHDIEIWTGPYHNKLQHPNQTNIVKSRNRAKVQQRINDSDIIHLKGDWPPNNGYLGLKITHKPIIITTSGSFFRKKEHGGHGTFHSGQYMNATVKTSFETDLLYPEYSDIWTPHPIDSDNQSIEWKWSDPPILMHTPTNRATKDTAFILKVFQHVKSMRKVEIILLEKLPFRKVVEMRKKATIFFDQFMVGFYGNSALEAMQYGIPTAAWLSPMATAQASGALKGCPVISSEKSVRGWTNMILKVLDNDLATLSQKSKQWCDNVHGYKAIAKQWDELYKSI